MSWAKIDDQMHSNEKSLECSLAARGLWVTCLSWVADKETDGAVPKSVVKLHAGLQWEELTGELVASGLWDETGTGWLFHDYLEYNPSREDLEKERRSAAERKAAWKAKRQQENGVGDSVPPTFTDTVPSPGGTGGGTATERRSVAVPNGGSNADGTEHPDPDPDPDKDDRLTIRVHEVVGRSSVDSLESLRERVQGLKGLAFVQAVLESKPTWAKALANAFTVAEEQSKAKSGKPIHNPLRWRVQVLTNWLSGDGTPDDPDLLPTVDKAEQDRLRAERERLCAEQESLVEAKMREVELGRAQVREKLARKETGRPEAQEAEHE